MPQRDEPPTQCVEPMSDRQRVQQTLCPLLRPAAPLSVGAAHGAPPEASFAAARPLGRCDGGGRAAAGVGRSHAPTALDRARWSFTRTGKYRIIRSTMLSISCYN